MIRCRGRRMAWPRLHRLRPGEGDVTPVVAGRLVRVVSRGAHDVVKAVLVE